MKTLANDALGQLSESHVDFFGKWIKALNFELEEENRKDNANERFWNETSIEREQKGLAIAKVTCALDADTTCRFTRSKDASDLPAISEISSQFRAGARVAISVDENYDINEEVIAVTTGYIEKFEGEEVVVVLAKEIQKPLLSSTFRIDVLPRDTSWSFSTNFTNMLR